MSQRRMPLRLGGNLAERARATWAILHPIALTGLLLLVVNDVWLKPRFHNVVTGKLSDIALMLFLPFYLCALFGLVTARRPRAFFAIVLSATLLVAIKTSPICSQLFCEGLAIVGRPFGILRARNIVDPTDLLALPFLAFPYWASVRSGRASTSSVRLFG